MKSDLRGAILKGKGAQLRLTRQRPADLKSFTCELSLKRPLWGHSAMSRQVIVNDDPRFKILRAPIKYTINFMLIAEPTSLP